MVEPDRLQMTIWYHAGNMRFASRITKARIHTQVNVPFYCLFIDHVTLS